MSEIRTSNSTGHTKISDLDEFKEEKFLNAGHDLQTIRALAILFFAICLSAILYYYWIEGKLVFNVPWLLIPVLVIVLGLVNGGYAMAGARILLWGLLLVTMAGSYWVSGVSTPSLYLLPVLTIASFSLLSQREAKMMFVIVTLNVSFQLYLQTHGWLPPISERPPAYYFLSLVSVMMVALLVGNATAKHLIAQYKKIRTMIQVLEKNQDRLREEVADRERSEANLAFSEEQLRFVLEGSEQGFWDWDIVTGTVLRNKRWAEMLGYTYEEIQQTPQQWLDFIHPEDRERAWRSINDVLEGRALSHKAEYRMLHKDGTTRWVLDQANVMMRNKNGAPTRMCGTHTDITERKNLEAELTREAHLDYLTGLINRRYFMGLAEFEINRANRYDKPLSLLMMDIDLFKRINDTYGHKMGDQVLIKLADVCKQILREVDIFGRIGGEEFAILLPETGKQEAMDVAERLRKAVADTKIELESGEKVLQISISIGLAVHSSKEENLDMLLSSADMALYKAKNSGRNNVCVS